MSDQFPKPGELFQERYRIAKVIGAGGFAQVYRAVQEDLEREVALKILIPAGDGPPGTDRASYSQKLVQRFHQEAKLVSRLRDPHTITMYDYGHAENGLLFMVFEYVNGLSLSQVVNRSGALKASRVIKILKQTLSSLHEAHALGMMHRDIKPANIMIYEHVGRPDQVKLLDFGIAKVFSEAEAPVNDLTTDGAIVGTPRYMSPEQILGKPLTPASDIYSLGLVGYEMLVGQKANDSHTSMTVIGRQLDPMSFAVPPELAIPPELRRVIDRMLVKKVEDRFATADEVIAALEAIEDISGGKRITGLNQALPSQPVYGQIFEEPQHTPAPHGHTPAPHGHTPAPHGQTPPPYGPSSGQFPIDPTPSGSRERLYGDSSGSRSQPFPPPYVEEAGGGASKKLALISALALGVVAILAIGVFALFSSDTEPTETDSLAVVESPETDEEASALANAATPQDRAERNKLTVTTHPSNLAIKIGDRVVGRSPVDIDLHGLSFPLTVTAELDKDTEKGVFLNRPDRPVFIDFTSVIEAQAKKEAEAAEIEAEKARKAAEAEKKEQAPRAASTPRVRRPKPAPAAPETAQKEAKKEEEEVKSKPTFSLPPMDGI
ncbi:MAG: serine/threonine-protein kinase [Bradymonadaceae bacterium]